MSCLYQHHHLLKENANPLNELLMGVYSLVAGPPCSGSDQIIPGSLSALKDTIKVKVRVDE